MIKPRVFDSLTLVITAVSVERTTTNSTNPEIADRKKKEHNGHIVIRRQQEDRH